jgi:hypothetical protein
MMKYNHHGFYFYSIAPSIYLRTTNIKMARRALINIMRRSPHGLHFHFRLASSGLVDKNNVHGWKVEDYYVSHNGFVSRYIRDEWLSDTYLLVNDNTFREYLRRAEWEKLYDYLVRLGFYGVMFLVKDNFEDIIAVAMDKDMRYYKIGDVVYATSRHLIKAKHKKYRNGVYRITYDGVETIISKPYIPLELLKYFKSGAADDYGWFEEEFDEYADQ